MRKINWTKIKADAVLITNPKNVRHFTNLKASLAYVIVDKKKTTLFADSRYFENANKVFKGEVILFKNLSQVKEALKGYNTVAFESDYVSVMSKDSLDKIHDNLVPINGQELRIVKSEQDIKDLKKAVSITKKVMKWASEQMKPGMTERELSRMVIFKLDEMGSETLDYDPIIAGGPNSSKPHAIPSSRKFKEGDTVMFDFAAVINGFTADLTRNYYIGKNKHPEIEKIRKIVKKAQLAGIKAVKPGVTGAQIDKICRDIITEAGYGDKFGHGTGHGLGRDVHELPNVGPSSNIKFKPGHVITVEPGIYIPGLGGIRIEDDILVTKDGHKVL